MKTTDHIKQMLLAVALALGMTCATPAFAIEGLQLSLQCSNVVLAWPSIPGHNYIIQYRPTLDPSTPWETLTNSYPADWTTNFTVFVHSNIVQNPCNCNAGSGSSAMMSSAAMSSSSSAYASPDNASSAISQPMVKPVNGSGATVPLALYPPGYDLSNFIIFDPNSGEWVSGVGYTTAPATFSANGATTDGATPDLPVPSGGGAGGGGTGSTSPPDMGFYQVVQDGVQILASSLANLTNGVLSNTISFGFEAGNADPNNGTNLLGTLNSAIVLIDGLKAPGDSFVSVTAGNSWVLTLDTAYLENGFHTLQVEAFWYDPTSGGAVDGAETLYPSRYSDSVNITVTNAVYYPQWEEDVAEAGTNAAFFLETTLTNADWSIDIYDVSSNFVQQITGHTDDGTIEGYWNMIDTSGVARTNADFDPEFSAVANVANAKPKPLPPKKHPKNTWPTEGAWAVAYQDYFRHCYDAGGDMPGHINMFANTVSKYASCYLYYPPYGSTNDVGQTYPLRYENRDHPEDGVTDAMLEKDATLLKTFLSSTNCRNFFYRGHGNPIDIAGINVYELASVISQRYRFVLLQCCNSADGPLDKAFGIKGPGEYQLSYYQQSGRRPATFVGNRGISLFNDRVPVVVNGVSYDASIPWQVPYLYYDFLFYWDTEQWDLTSAINQAISDMPPIDNWGGPQPGYQLVIYGYPFIHIDEYNQRTSWP